MMWHIGTPTVPARCVPPLALWQPSTRCLRGQASPQGIDQEEEENSRRSLSDTQQSGHHVRGLLARVGPTTRYAAGT